VERVALVDGSGLLVRAWHAMPGDLHAADGTPTGAVYGFATAFRKLLLGRRARFGAVAFDAGGPTWRHGLDPTYKAHRPPFPEGLRVQVPWVDALVAAHGFPVLRAPGVEADDIIATLTRRALQAGHEVWVVSADKDLAQLVGPRVRLWDPTEELLYDVERVRKKWGVLPERLGDLLALAGDAADGVPGVPGVGRRAATDLLSRFGSLDAILANPSALPARVRRSFDAGSVARSRALVSLREDVDVPEFDALVVPEPDPERLNEIYRRLQFHSFLAPSAASGARAAPPEHWLCDTEESVRAALEVECRGEVAVHVVIELEGHLRGEIAAVGLSPRSGRAVAVPSALLPLLAPWLADANAPKVLHEAKCATAALANRGIALGGVVGDTALASWLLDPTLCVPHRIEQCAREWLGRALQPVASMVGSGPSAQRFADLPVGRLAAYATHMADATGDLWRVLRPRLADAGLLGRLRDLELPLSACLADMERAGIRVDRAAVDSLGATLAAERDAVADRLVAAVGHAFNPGSLRQLQAVLYEEMGLPVLRRTRTGYATDAATLTRLRRHAPAFIDDLLLWRDAARRIDATTDVLRASVWPEDGRVHATFHQTVGAAGRLITSHPDLQRTPNDAAVRRCFVADPGSVLVTADWSQIELRLLAHLSREPALIGAFREGADVHRRTAAALFGASERDVTAAQRDTGKAVNFATLYGQGPAALAEQLAIPVDTARGFIDAWFAALPRVAPWKEGVVATAYATGGVRTLLGAWRRIPELKSHDPTERAYGERIAVNTAVQGSAADLLKVAMCAIHRDLPSGSRLVLTMHDELVVEAPEALAQAVGALLVRHMEGAASLDVPLVAEVHTGRTWARSDR
jgi:DNA polymerase-1